MPPELDIDESARRIPEFYPGLPAQGNTSQSRPCTHKTRRDVRFDLNATEFPRRSENDARCQEPDIAERF